MLKKFAIAACCSVLVCLAVTLWIVPSIKAANAGEHFAPSSDVSVKPMYIVGEYEGHVAVFEYGEIRPFQILESTTAALPDTDRAMLERGIEVTDDTELIRILEDYSE